MTDETSSFINPAQKIDSQEEANLIDVSETKSTESLPNVELQHSKITENCMYALLFFNLSKT